MSAHGPVPVLPGPALLGALLVQPVPSLNDGRHEVVGSVAPPVVVHNETMKHWYAKISQPQRRPQIGPCPGLMPHS